VSTYNPVSAGADLSKHAGSFQLNPSNLQLEYADLLRQAWACPVPLVARINGHRLTGEPIDAHRAKRIGLVNHVVPAAKLDAKTEWWVARIADKSPTANRRGKAMIRAELDRLIVGPHQAHLETRHGPLQDHARRPRPPARRLAASIPCFAERRYGGVRDGMTASYPSIKEMT
jgi:enoyl-CoA hydratase/carnithine racemase